MDRLADTVYMIEPVFDGREYLGEKVVSAKIGCVTIKGKSGKPVFDLYTESGGCFTAMTTDKFWKTQEDAEKALKKRQGCDAI